MAIDRAQVRKDGRLFRQDSGRAGADLPDFHADFGAGGALILNVERTFDGAGELIDQLFHFLVALGTDVHLGARERRDSVDAGAAFDEADVDAALGRVVDGGIGEQRNGASQRVQRIAHAIVAPALWPPGPLKITSKRRLPKACGW